MSTWKTFGEEFVFVLKGFVALVLSIREISKVSSKRFSPCVLGVLQALGMEQEWCGRCDGSFGRRMWGSLSSGQPSLPEREGTCYKEGKPGVPKNT